MRRLVWVSLGATGGILVYRKAQDLLESAKEKGMLLTISDTSASLRGLAQGASEQITKFRESSTPPRAMTGSAASAVRDRAEQ